MGIFQEHKVKYQYLIANIYRTRRECIFGVIYKIWFRYAHNILYNIINQKQDWSNMSNLSLLPNGKSKHDNLCLKRIFDRQFPYLWVVRTLWVVITGRRWGRCRRRGRRYDSTLIVQLQLSKRQTENIYLKF